MVRVLLVVMALAAPALSAAQSVGQVLFVNDRVNPNTINAGECAVGSMATVVVRWTPQFINNNVSAPVSGAYIVYGTNTAPGATSTPAGQCPQQNTSSGNNVLVGTVLDTTNTSAPGATSATISLPWLLQGAGFSPASGCPPDGTTVYICVQGVVNDINSMATNFAIASAAVTIYTALPQVPVITGVTSGDGALIVSWEPGTVGTGTAITQRVELEVEPIASTTSAWDTGGARSTGKWATSPARVEGLVNGVVYDVRARAFSDAANVSDFSPAGVTTGMPQAGTEPASQGGGWRSLAGAGGGSGGGCSSGVAGPFGLAILAGVLALARTGRRR
jgi:hypothetical protein